MDIADLGLSTVQQAWHKLLQRRERGNRVERGEVMALLKSGEPVPVELNPFLEEIVSGRYKFRPGNKPWYQNPLGTPEFIASSVDYLEALIADPSLIPTDYDKAFVTIIDDAHKKAMSRRGRISANRQAREITAQAHGISVRQVGTMITEFNRRLCRMAEEKGHSAEKIKAALRFGRHALYPSP